MKKIKISVEYPDGNNLSRWISTETLPEWSSIIENMLDTLEKSSEPMGDMTGFEGTTEALNKLSI